MLLSQINYQKLKTQKDILNRMILSWNKSEDPQRKKDAIEAEGLMNLLDSIQDNAVQYLGFTEEEVFE